MAIKIGGTTVIDDSRNISAISISGLTTPLSLAQGGTAGTTAGTARTALGLVIGTDVLAPNGSAASLTSFPTLNQNTSGSAASLSATLAVASGGTGVTSSTGSTSVVLSNSPSLTNPTITNYVETPYSANSSTAITLALSNGTVQIITLTGNATITMPTAVSGKSFTILLRQDATGSRTVTWSTVSWPSATAPTITTTASKMDKYVFISDGTYWYGSNAGQNYS